MYSEAIIRPLEGVSRPSSASLARNETIDVSVFSSASFTTSDAPSDKHNNPRNSFISTVYSDPLQHIGQLTIPTRGKGLYDITAQVARWVADHTSATALLTLFCRHTSASLTIQENYDPDVIADIKDFFERLVPEDPRQFRHTLEGPDDMPAHIRTVLSGIHLSIPIDRGQLTLGTWQGIYLFEHRRHPHERNVVLHLLTEDPK